MQHSCEGCRFIEELYPILLDLELYFNATSTADKLTLNISNRLEKIYKTWCGASWNETSTRVRINGKQERRYNIIPTNI
jgi:hypothetical protein